MKTPLQELIEKLDKTIDSNISIPATWSYLDAIQAVREIAEYLLEKEKDCIVAAYEFGWDDGTYTNRPVNDVIYIDGEDFYNKKFNVKEEQRKLLKEITEADEKDGLYDDWDNTIQDGLDDELNNK